MSLPKVILVEKNHTSYHILKIPASSIYNSIRVRFAQNCILQNNFTLIKEEKKREEV